jgi:hypothetical protein
VIKTIDDLETEFNESKIYPLQSLQQRCLELPHTTTTWIWIQSMGFLKRIKPTYIPPRPQIKKRKKEKENK